MMKQRKSMFETAGIAALALAVAAACGSSPGGGDGPDGGNTGPDGDGGVFVDDELSTASGCNGVYNPDQILDYNLEMAPGDWSSVQADATFSVYYPATLSCGDETPIMVGVRRKRSGGTEKVGLKIDINEYVAGQTWFGIKKLSLENGVSTGETITVGGIVAEYMGWRVMVLARPHTGRAALAQFHVNGESLGVYVNVEQVDKRFLGSHFGDKSGWLFKHSGGDGDGYKTNEGIANPYADYFCFWDTQQCPTPTAAELATTLPDKLDIPQILRMGAANAIMANTDSPIFKNNNYYFYDWAGGREYLPWDLDTTQRDTNYDLFAGGGGGQTARYVEVLFINWEDDYAQIARDLVAGPLSLESLEQELSRIEQVSGAALDADAYAQGDTASTVASLRTWWQARVPTVKTQLDAHP